MCFMSDWKHHPISTQGIIMNHLHELKLKVIFKLHKTGHLPTHVKMIRGYIYNNSLIYGTANVSSIDPSIHFKCKNLNLAQFEVFFTNPMDCFCQLGLY